LAEAQKLGYDKFVFKYKPTHNELASFVAEQLSLQKNASEKLPTFFKKNCFYTKKLLEQATAEYVALYKSNLIKGDNLLVLAGGLGVDEWAFSPNFKHIVSVEIDETVNDLVDFNFHLLQVPNIKRISADATDYVKECNTFYEAVYTDPDRRNDGKREILLSEHQPNIIALLPHIQRITNHLYIKCSPMYDHQMAINELNQIESIYFISLKGEMKEMLIHVNFEKDVEDKAIHLICANIENAHYQEVKYLLSDSYSRPALAQQLSGYFYETGASLVKARLNHLYAYENEWFAVDYAVPFYISSLFVPNSIGRVFKIVSVQIFNQQFKNYLKTEKITKANIKCRGLGIKTEEVYKKLGLKEGGHDYLFVCPHLGQKTVIHCVKVD
jgi:hypothetical protein